MASFGGETGASDWNIFLIILLLYYYSNSSQTTRSNVILLGHHYSLDEIWQIRLGFIQLNGKHSFFPRTNLHWSSEILSSHDLVIGSKTGYEPLELLYYSPLLKGLRKEMKQTK